MHALDLVDHLVAFLQQSLSDYLLMTKSGENRSPAVFDGFLPAKKNNKRGQDTETDEEYPYIVVRYIGEEDDIAMKNSVVIKLIIGTFNPDEQKGWRDVSGLIIRIKSLLKEQHLFDSAVLTGKIKTAIFEGQTKPLWHGLMEIEFDLPQIQIKNKELMENGYY